MSDDELRDGMQDHVEVAPLLGVSTKSPDGPIRALATSSSDFAACTAGLVGFNSIVDVLVFVEWAGKLLKQPL